MQQKYRISLGRHGETLVDKEDFFILSGYKWGFDGRYVKRTIRRPYKTTIRLHRVIMRARGDEIVDHIDGDVFNNSRSNLRFVTHSQSSMNRGKRRDNSTGYKGVYFFKNKWGAKIGFQGQVKFLGYFDTPEEAAVAYEEASKIYHSNFRRVL